MRLFVGECVDEFFCVCLCKMCFSVSVHLCLRANVMSNMCVCVCVCVCVCARTHISVTNKRADSGGQAGTQGVSAFLLTRREGVRERERGTDESERIR